MPSIPGPDSMKNNPLYEQAEFIPKSPEHAAPSILFKRSKSLARKRTTTIVIADRRELGDTGAQHGVDLLIPGVGAVLIIQVPLVQHHIGPFVAD